METASVTSVISAGSQSWRAETLVTIVINPDAIRQSGEPGCNVPGIDQEEEDLARWIPFPPKRRVTVGSEYRKKTDRTTQTFDTIRGLTERNPAIRGADTDCHPLRAAAYCYGPRSSVI
ncbi:hypothetical protein Bbelb_196830 [Branchiostoma belcheri]|nr:hypothetical protein Bbelb_196830 [Branchiostoma belcheri]